MKGFEMRTFPLTNFTEPRSGAFIIHCDSWWPVTADGQIFFWGNQRSPYHSPQCNASQKVATVANSSLITAAADYHEIRQIPIVYVPINWSDYRD